MTTIITTDHTIHVQHRSVVIVGAVITTKVFLDPADCATEVHWYHRVPFACPALIDHNDRHLVIETWPAATTLTADFPLRQLRNLLLDLEDIGAHHRDVHPANVVLTDQGPRLIDWEAVTWCQAPSYDLYGPNELVPMPTIHTTPMWWDSDDPGSIRNLWTP